MSEYLPESRRLEYGNISYSPIALEAAKQAQGGRHAQDSILFREAASKDAVLKQVAAGMRVTLPTPKGSQSHDELAILAEAFVKAFSAMDKGLISQTQDYTQMQQLDQMQSKCVLESTTNAINQEMEAAQLATQIADYQKKMATDQEILGWTLMGVGAAVMLATFISGFFTFGATDAALPAEAEMLEMGAGALADAAEEGAGDGADALDAADADLPDDANLPDPNAASNSEAAATNGGDNAAEQTQQATTRDLASNEGQAAKSAKDTAISIGKRLLKFAVSVGFSSPSLMQAVAKFTVANQLKELAGEQANVGSALNTMQTNNMFFQFTQQLTQRQGGVIQEEANDATEVISTYADITSAYRGISYNLANAV